MTATPNIDALAAADPMLAEADARFARSWDGGDPPLTMRLASLARALVELVKAEGVGPRASAVLDQAERALADGSDAERDAVATGFVEALLAASEDPGFDVAAVRRAFGPQTDRYARDWDDFTGVYDD